MNTGNNLLYLLVSALLGFMAVSGVLGKWNLAGVAVRFHPADEIYAGRPTLLGVELVNRRRRLPIFLMEVVLADRALFFPLVDCRGARRKSLEFTFAGRGRQALPEAVVRSRFPVNFFIRSQGVPVAGEVTVFPAPLPCAEQRQAAPGGGQERSSGQRRAHEGDIDRIGDYRGGEPLKAIHWKLSARHDRLKVKQASAATRQPVLLDLSELPGPGLERRLGQACFLVTRWLRAGWPVGLKGGGLSLPPGAGRRHKILLLQALARHGQD